jgi:hypothetical protein
MQHPLPDSLRREAEERTTEMKTFTQSIGKGWSSITTGADGTHYGPVGTPHGFVVASGSSGSTCLQFIHGGKAHYRYVDQSVSARFLATMAKRFAKEIATKKAAKKGGR